MTAGRRIFGYDAESYAVAVLSGNPVEGDNLTVEIAATVDCAGGCGGRVRAGDDFAERDFCSAVAAGADGVERGLRRGFCASGADSGRFSGGGDFVGGGGSGRERQFVHSERGRGDYTRRGGESAGGEYTRFGWI